MAQQQRSKKSTVSNAVKTMDSAAKCVAPPFELGENENNYFKFIVIAREHETWSDNDLLIAANLAKTYSAIDQLWGDIQSEGYVVENQRGTPVANPKVSALNSMTSAMQSLNKTLGLSASQRGLSGAKQATRNSAEQQARKVIQKVSEDDLI